MIQVDTGEEFELYKHNVRFEDSTKEIVVDTRTKTYWIGADRVSYDWIHKEDFEAGKEGGVFGTERYSSKNTLLKNLSCLDRLLLSGIDLVLSVLFYRLLIFFLIY
jgi:hypothetical protein